MSTLDSNLENPFAKYIYLASKSLRRRELLGQINIPYKLLTSNDDEYDESLEEVNQAELPLDYVKRITLLKLEQAMLRHQQINLPIAPILCSDTTVAIGNNILGKPADEEDAVRMLSLLQGREHQVLTAVVVALPADAGKTLGEDKKRLSDMLSSQSCVLVSVSEVTLAPMSAAQIKAYVLSGEPMGKAGAYAIQGRMASYVKHISGSYSGIMGLPLFETAELLRPYQLVM